MTVHEVSAAAAAEELLATPGGAEVLIGYAKGLRAGRWSPGYRAAFADPTWASGRDYAQVWAFAQIHATIGTSAAALVWVEVGEAPHRDSAREANAAALAHIPAPFAAYLDPDQHKGDCDGVLEWAAPILATVTDRSTEWDAEIPPVPYVPLEVGSARPSRVLAHLRDCGAVARWPYGETKLWVLVGLPTPLDYQAAVKQSVAAVLAAVPLPR